ncbi:MAG TPA: hypothetical protein VIM16_02495 [Mucilaginibacter sp.]|jgi:hypothetical protein
MKPYPAIGKILLFLFLYAILSMFSCGIQNGINKLSFAKPVSSVDSAANKLAYGAGQNVILGLTDSSRAAIQKVIRGLKGSMDTLNPEIKKMLVAINAIGDTTNLQITKIGKNIHWQIGNLQGDLNGTVSGLTSAFKINTKTILSDIIQTALDSLKAPSSKIKIDSIVSGVLDKNTDARAQKLVSSALQPTIDSLAKKIDFIVHKDVPFVQKQAGILLAILAAVAIAIIGFVWYERSKYARLVKILTYQIDKIPNPDVYNDLTGKISSQTKNEDLEPLLRKTLRKQGIND